MVDNQKLIHGGETGQQIRPPSHTSVVRSSVAVESERKFQERSSKKSSSEMCAALSRCLREDLLAADAKWNLFIAACQSYRYDSCLKPFPPMFLNTTDNTKDIDLLLKIIDTVPAFELLLKFLSDGDKFKLNDTSISLLYWVLIHPQEPSLKTVPKEKFDDVLNLVPCELTAQRPDFVFELKYVDSSVGSIKWTNYKRNYRTLYAYHGSKLENFHSIINYGLHLSLTKTPLFGQGIYLSSELLVSLPYSSTGFGWGKSVMGAELSVVALCEMLDHPSTHCQTSGDKDKNRAMASDSIAGKVPHKYYVVANNELIRIQYLLVYARSRPTGGYNVSGAISRKDSIMEWIKEHKLLTAIFGYVFLLASVGLSNNQHILRYYRMFLSKVGMN